MLYLAWDSETACFGPGRRAPALTCVSMKYEKGEELLHWTEAKEVFYEVLYDSAYIHIGHNIAFDFSVLAAEWPELLPAIFRAYEDNRVRDTLIRQKLHDIATGRYRGFYKPPSKKDLEKGLKRGAWVQHNYDLKAVCKRHTGRELEKDEWRKRYAELRNVPIKLWPEGAQKYPMDDARAPWDIYWSQESFDKRIIKALKEYAPWIENPRPLGDESFQCKAAWWMCLMQAWGVRTDPKRVKAFKKEVESKFIEYREDLKKTFICPHCGEILPKREGACPEHGHVVGDPVVRANNVRDTKAAKRRMETVMGGKSECRLTKTGNISLDEESCKLADDPTLTKYSSLTSLQTVVSKDVPMLMRGRFMPVHSSFNTLLATGRTSSSKPNIQNIRTLPGIRECFLPRAGNVFLDCDYDGLELRTLAQVCLRMVGYSKLAEVLNSGLDPHLVVAAQIMKVSYEEAERLVEIGDKRIGDARALAKIANFGFPGGMGILSLLEFAKGFGSVGKNLTEKDVKKLRQTWFKTYPEMAEYFRLISNICDEGEGNLAIIEQLFTHRIRGDIRYTAACNTFFQGLGSDATKEAGWELSKACYIEKDSPLYGCRIVNYVHDQFIIECPEERAHEAIMEMKRIMETAATRWLPDVPATVKKPVICRRWSKNAKQIWSTDGKLLPWDEADAA